MGLPSFDNSYGNLLKGGRGFLNTFSTSVSGVVYHQKDGTPKFKKLWGICWREDVVSLIPCQHLSPRIVSAGSVHVNVADKSGGGMQQMGICILVKEYQSMHIRCLTTSSQKLVIMFKRECRQLCFAWLMFGLHIKHCGMTQCDVDPSNYSKYEWVEDGKTKVYLFAAWTGDDRYFGTPRFVANVKKNVSMHINCKIEENSTEFDFKRVFRAMV